LQVLEQAACSILATEPGTFDAARQAPVAAGIQAQVGVGQRAPLVRLGRAGV